MLTKEQVLNTLESLKKDFHFETVEDTADYVLAHYESFDAELLDGVYHVFFTKELK